MKCILLCFSFFLFFSPVNGQQKTEPLYGKKNLVAWCIVPFDSKKRNAEERAMMLQKLGITSFAYDWRVNDLPLMATEFSTLKKYNITLSAVWFWITGGGNNLLDETNETILNTIKQTQTKTELWVSFPEEYFNNMNEEERITKAVKVIRYVHRRAAEIGCTVALYNHGAWFGEPANQVALIKASGLKDVGIVYNFHHAHQQLDNFDEILRITKPYLSTVNLNGMKIDGPKIMTLGDGNREMELMKKLKASGFKGSIGIIGHTENEDVEIVLKRNLTGLQKILKEMGDAEAFSTYSN